jgi:hypothetical protein
MNSNATRGLTGIEIIIVVALTMIAVAFISPALSARSHAAKPAVKHAGFLHAKPTRYQTDRMDEGLLFAANARPELSSNDLLVTRRQALVLAGKIKPDSPRSPYDVLMQAADAGLNAAFANAGKPKMHLFLSACPVKSATAGAL